MSEANDQIAPPLPPLSPSVFEAADSITPAEGEVFDSGTESGEDAMTTRSSNHSQSDLTSFMANLKLTLDLGHHSNECQNQSSMTCSSSTSYQSTDQLPNNEEMTPKVSTGSPALPDFLTQVDSVLDRLKVSLKGSSGQDDTTASYTVPPTESNSVTTEVLHEYIASGGLNQRKPWQMHPNQQSELISLIDRLQSSLHDLQSGAQNVTPPSNEILPQSSSGTTLFNESSTIVRQKSPPITLPKPSSTPRTTTPLALSVPSTPPTEAPPEPLTPPPPPPLPPDGTQNSKPVGWRTAFLKSSSGSTVCHRPVWCRRDSQEPESSPALRKSTTDEKISPQGLKETPGLRGRFTPQQLRPAPKIIPKPAAPLKLPSHILNKISSTKESDKEPAPSAFLASPLKQSMHHKGSSTRSSTNKPLVNTKGRETNEKSTIKKTVAAVTSKPMTLVDEVKGSTSTAITTSTNANTTITTTTTTTTNSERNNRKQGAGRTGGSGGDLPWKVKLAKKKAARSQTVLMDGSVSVDLRKSINKAALRKSMEDLRVIGLSSVKDQPKIFTATHQMPSAKTESHAAYPLLKQKSLGELYSSKPKPFRRGDTVIGFLPTKKANQNEKKDTSESSVISTLCWTPTVTSTGNDIPVGAQSSPEAQFSSNLVILPKVIPKDTTNHAECIITQSTSSNAVRSPLKRQEAISRPPTESQSENEEELRLQPVPTTVEEPIQLQESVVEIKPIIDTVVEQMSVTGNKAIETDKSDCEKPCSDQLNNQLSAETIYKSREASSVTVEGASKISTETQVSLNFEGREGVLQHPTQSTSKESILVSAMNVTDEDSVTTGILRFSPSFPVNEAKQLHSTSAAVSSSDPSCTHHDSGISESTTPDPILAKSETSDETDIKDQDPSQMLFTPLESIQIAVHKAAINKQISEEEARRRDGNKTTKTQSALPVESTDSVPLESVPITNSESNPQIFKKSAPEKCSRERSRRSNTIAITMPELKASNKSQVPWKPSSFSAAFQVKTENDRKFQNFFTHNQSEESNSVKNRRILLPIESEPPGGNGMKWTNKFSNIRSAFESKPEDDTKSPVRSRRTSGEDSAGGQVTAANLRVQINSGNIFMKTTEPKSFFSGKAVASRSPQPLEKSRLHSLARFSNSQSVPDPPQLFKDTSKRISIKEPISKKAKSINTLKPTISEVRESVTTKKDPIVIAGKESLWKNTKLVDTQETSTGSARESVTTRRNPILVNDKETILHPSKRQLARNEQPLQLSKESTGGKAQSIETHGGIAKVTSSPRMHPSSNSGRYLRKDISSSSIWTTASAGSFDLKDEKEEEDDYGDDEASSSSMSDEDDQQDASSTTESTRCRTNSSGMNRLSKLIKKYSSMEDINQESGASSPVRPQITVNARRSPAWNPPVVSVSSPGVFKSMSNQFIPTGEWRTRSDDIASIEIPVTPPPVPPRQLKPNPPEDNETFKRPQTLCGLKSSSASALNTLAGYVEPPGPTLVGLVARNVRSVAPANSITHSAMNFAGSVTGMQVQPLNDISPTSLIIKSVSSSRIVNEAKEQLSKRPDFLQTVSGVRSRPQSLVVPSQSPTNCEGDGVQRRSSGRVVGNKQYEASLSPESAEKKQRELSKFFNESNPAVTPTERSSSASKVATSPVQVRYRARSVATTARPRAVSEGASLSFPSPPDDLSSDVDELFDRLLASDNIADTRGSTSVYQRVPRRESVSPPRNTAAQSLDQISPNGDSSSHLSAKSKFNDRRRVWEQSSKIHLNESINLISE